MGWNRRCLLTVPHRGGQVSGRWRQTEVEAQHRGGIQQGVSRFHFLRKLVSFTTLLQPAALEPATVISLSKVMKKAGAAVWTLLLLWQRGRHGTDCYPSWRTPSMENTIMRHTSMENTIMENIITENIIMRNTGMENIMEYFGIFLYIFLILVS